MSEASETATEATFGFDVSQGTVYVTIVDADTDGRRAYADGWLGQPRVRVHTDPQPTVNGPHGFLKLRGRGYRIDKTFQRLPDDAGEDLDGNPRIWQVEPSNGYQEGYRNEHLVRVGRDAKAWDQLDEIVYAVLDRFENSQPDWRRESVRQAWLDLRQRHQDIAEEASKTLRKAAETIAEIDKKLAVLR